MNILVCPTCSKTFSRKYLDIRNKKNFCSFLCGRKFYNKEKLPIGTIKQVKDSNGNLRNYIQLPNHPNVTNNRIIYARWVMEKKLRRFLKPHEIVHHINENQLDDRAENLRVLRNKEEHDMIHHPKNYQFSDIPTILSTIYETFGIEQTILTNPDP